MKWSEKMKGDPNKRNRNKYCRFHRDHGHDMDECFDLKQQIENLIRQGKLRNFLERDQKDEKLKGKIEESSLGVCAGRIGRVKANISIQSAISGLEKFLSAINPPKSKSGELVTNFGGFNLAGYAG